MLRRKTMLRSQVSAVGYLVQVFRFGCRHRVLSLNLRLYPHLNLQPRPGTREYLPTQN